MGDKSRIVPRNIISRAKVWGGQLSKIMNTVRAMSFHLLLVPGSPRFT